MDIKTMLGNLPPADAESVRRKLIERITLDLLIQQTRKWNYYPVRSVLIEPQANVPATIAIAGDADFICELMYIVIDKAFSTDTSTILMKITDAGSMELITREPLDLRAIASPGIFDPATANEAVAHVNLGVKFPYIFRKNSNIQFDFESTELAEANDHKVSVILAGHIIRNWDRIPHALG